MNRVALQIELDRLERSDALLFKMVRAALAAGDAIAGLSGTVVAETKGDNFVGHHSIVTTADYLSQDIILSSLSDFSDARFIAEEAQKGPLEHLVLNKDNYAAHLGGLVFGVDSLDGTSQFQRGMYEWSVSIGAMNAMNHVAGVVYAPMVNNGLLVYGSKTSGVFLLEHNRAAAPARIANTISSFNAMALFGVDAAMHTDTSMLHQTLAKKFRTTNVNGSCALGLALVASGKADCFIQPVQRVWDWHAGKALVELAGGKVAFYHKEEKQFRDEWLVVPVSRPSAEDYTPACKRLGFVAGEASVVDGVLRTLEDYSSLQYSRRRHDSSR